MRRSVRNLLARSARLLEQQGGHVGNTTTNSVVAPFAMASRNFADTSDLLKTALYDFHVEHGGACVLAIGCR